MRNTLLTLVGLVLTFFLSSYTVAAEFCDDQYYINKTMPNGASWDMCWTHDSKQGVRYHHVFYKPKDDVRRMVLFDASIAQIHVPYDDNGARYHDVSDFGLGGNNLIALSSSECPNGQLSYYNSKAALCQQVIKSGPAYRNLGNKKEQYYLKLFSISAVGEYFYALDWVFYDDGRIVPSIQATGSLQRFGGLDKVEHGWSMAVGTGGSVGLAHMHNFYWRLDFDLDQTGENDKVQEINHVPYDGKRYSKLTTFSNEVARSVDPVNMRSWLISDTNTVNNKGHNIAYEVRLSQSGQREVGPSFEPFTYSDFYVSHFKDCERIASHNKLVFTDCNTNNLNEFVDNESIEGRDIVTWVGVSFYHMPRSEDAPYMDTHESTFQIIPRSWHTTNPVLDIQPPIQVRLSASADYARTDNESAVIINVLANDTGNSISFHTLDNPDNGLARTVNNQVEYRPNAGFVGTDTFWYAIKDSTGRLYGTQIHVTVTEPQLSSAGGGGGLTQLPLFVLSILGLYFGVSRKSKH